MFKTEKISLMRFYAVSPLHAGSGAALSTVDLPIQRERHTNWPHVQSSAVKGALRSHFRDFNTETGIDGKDARFVCNIIFGSDTQDGWQTDTDGETLPGSLSVSDAKLLAFPVRSSAAPFVWVTSPSVLSRLKTDMEMAGLPHGFNIPQAKDEKAVPINCSLAGKLIIEDAAVSCEPAVTINELSALLSGIDRLLLVSDVMYDYCVSNCTEVQAQIKISALTGTAVDGALRYQEFLPSDSLLYSVVCFGRQKFAKNEFQVGTIMDYFKKVFHDGGFVQLGGDETLGRGICRTGWVEGGK